MSYRPQRAPPELRRAPSRRWILLVLQAGLSVGLRVREIRGSRPKLSGPKTESVTLTNDLDTLTARLCEEGRLEVASRRSHRSEERNGNDTMLRRRGRGRNRFSYRI